VGNQSLLVRKFQDELSLIKDINFPFLAFAYLSEASKRRKMMLEKVLEMLVGKLSGWLQQFILLLPNLAIAVILVLVFWLVARLAKNLSLKLLGRVSSMEEVNRLLGTLVFLSLFTAGVFMALGIVGLDKTVTSLLAGAGILALAIGFAFQDIASNFMAGIFLSIRRPFQTGHLIESNRFHGIVERISLRSTELRTPQGQLVLIPNKEVFQNPIINYTLTGKRRIDLKVGVSYQDDLEKVRQAAVQAVEGMSSRDKERPVELFYEEFGDSSINFVIRFWIDSSKHDFWRARSEAIEWIKRGFDENGITIPFPIQTLDFSGASSKKVLQILADEEISREEKFGRH
jgi:small conductance mechanosensitive channel